MVPVAEGSRTADPRPSPRGDSAGPGRSDVGARAGRARGASGPDHGGRPAAVSDGARAVLPNRGAGPAHDHEEGAIEEAAAVTAGRFGAALSGIAGLLALSRTVDNFCAAAVRTEGRTTATDLGIRFYDVLGLGPLPPQA